MHISIREQLALLVLFCCLVCIAVISISVWITNLNFVNGISSTSLALIASLYAQQLSSNLFLLSSSAQGISTRVLIQSALMRYNAGNNTDANWLRARTDLQTALYGGGSSQSLLQARVVPQNDTGLNGPNPVLDITTVEEGQIRLPYQVDGHDVYLGDDEHGYPPELYPNITYSSTPYNSTYNESLASYQGAELNKSEPLFLGPWQINSTYALCSITYPIANNTSAVETLGWITIVANAQLVLAVQNATLGLGSTGVVLITGPRNRTNRYPPNVLPQNDSAPPDPTILGSQPMRFVVSPSMNSTRSLRHPQSSFGRNYTFKLNQFPAALNAWTSPQDQGMVSGSMLDTYNEVGDRIAAGYAEVQSSLADWAIVIEQSYDEVVRPITNLRNVLLACLFGTTGFVLLLMFPVAHYFARPIRRLRSATLKTVDPYGYPSSSELGFGSNDNQSSHSREEEDAHMEAVARKEGFARRASTRITGWWPFHRDRDRRRHGPRVAPADRRFRIPGKVVESKHLVRDELTELSHTFNEMVEELMMQYTRLEERVRERTRELELSKKAAEAANESKTLFIANISHELKTPLNGILGMCAVCLSEDDPTKIKRSLGIIYKSGDLLLNLLTDLLTFSKNQIGQQLTLDEKDFRLADISSQVLSIFDQQAREAGIHLQTQFEGPNESLETASGTPGQPGYGPFGTGRVKDMCLWGDQHRILQVLINLVSNSLKFTPADGSITVSIRCTGEVDPSQDSRRPGTSRVSSVGSRGSRVSYAQSNGRPRGRPRGLPSSGSGSSVHTGASGRSQSGEKNMHTALEINSRDSKALPQIHAREHSDGPALINAKTLSFEFEVQDTGPGIPPAQQQQVFEPFVQGDLGLSKKYGGTGLGLSICSQLATLMRGEITLQSEEGSGSTFTMRIPLRFVKERADSTTSSSINGSARNSFSLATPKDDPSTARAPRHSGSDSDLSVTQAPAIAVANSAPVASPTSKKTFESSPAVSKPRLVGLSQPFFAASSPLETQRAQLEAMERVAAEASRSGARIRVLVAEDNKVNQEVVLRMLKLEDIYDVTVAKDGQEALDLVRESMTAPHPFNLVFMDIQMPNLDGLQSTRQIRSLGFSAPIVALTAFSDESNARECIDSGMDFFLPKPIKRPALKQVLKRYCPTIPEEKEPGADGTSPKGKRKQKDEKASLKEEKEREEGPRGSAGQPSGQTNGAGKAQATAEVPSARPATTEGDSSTTQTSEGSEAGHTIQPTSPEPVSEKPTPLS